MANANTVTTKSIGISASIWGGNSRRSDQSHKRSVKGARFRRSILTTAVNLTVAFASGSVLAQQPARSALMLEEVVVTAQKREQSMQDVGVSVTALSGDQLNALGYSNVTEITAQAPSVQFTSFHQSYAAINIRGVSQNNFADNLEPPIALYVDEAYVPHPGAMTAQMFDIERAEILRGPQGTLFGRNATGGLVHLISRKPSDSVEGYLSVDAGEYNLRKFEGAVSVPLSDSLRSRFSFYRHEQDGWFKNRIGEDLMDADNYALRAQLDWDPSERTNVYLKLHASRNDDESGNAYTHTPTAPNAIGLGRELGSDESFSWPNIVLGGSLPASCPGCDLLGYEEPDDDPRTGAFDQRGSFNRDIEGATLKIRSDFDGFSFVSVTDFLRLEKDFDGDIDASPNPYFLFTTGQDSDHFAQELRLESQISDDLSGMVGLYYLDIDSAFLSQVDFDASPYLGLPFGSAVGANPADFDIFTTSWAAFAHLEYAMSDSLNLIFGLRYTEDEREMDYVVTNANAPGSPFIYNKNTHDDAVQEFENISARAEINWHMTDSWMLFASYTRGHKAGNFSAPSFGLPADPAVREAVIPTLLPHDEEVLTSTEIGFKGTFWDERARLNASVYYYDYQDYQVFSLQNASQTIVNRDATVSGGEIELTLYPANGLDIQAGFSSMWEKSIEDVPLPGGLSGDRDMPMSPNMTFNTLVRYEWPVFNGYMAAQVDYRWTDEFFFFALNEPVTKQDSYSVTNARISYTTADEKWLFAIWGKNLGETDYKEFALDIGALSVCSCSISAPRWFGGSVKYQW